MITQTMMKITQDALSGERLSQSQVVSKRKYDWADKQRDSTKVRRSVIKLDHGS